MDNGEKGDLILSRKGRFLKKNGSLYRICKIAEYDFESISEIDVIYPDNPKGNIIHERLHRRQDIEKSLNPNNVINENLEDKNMRAPIIMPRDFTDDWLEEKRKAKRRSSKKYEDEDEFEMALEEEEQRRKKVLKTNASQANKEEIKDENFKPLDVSEIEQETSSSNNSDDSAKVDGLKQLQIPQLESNQPMEIVGKAIKDMSHQISPEPNSSDENMQLAEQSFDFEKLAEEAKEVGFAQGYEEGEKKALQENQTKLEKQEQILKQLTEEMQKKKKEILKHTQNQFEQLVGAVTEAIVGKELIKDPNQLSKLLQRAIDESIEDDSFKIYVSKKVFDLLSQNENNPLKDNLFIDENLKDFNFRIDSNLSSVESGLRDIVSDLLKKADIDLFSEES